MMTIMCASAEARRPAPAAGKSIILEGSYKRAAERDLVQELAREQGAGAIFLYCNCPLDVVKERLDIRAKDPKSISNGRAELLEAQALDFDAVDFTLANFWGINTGKELPEVLEKVKYLLDRVA